MKQVLAVLVAIALIGGAYWARTEFIEGEDPQDSQSDPDAGGGDGDDRGGDVVCDERLGDACPAGATQMDVPELLEAFAGQTAGQASAPDVLIAPSAVVEMVEGSLQSVVEFGEPEVLATTVLTLVTFVDTQRAAAQDDCGQAPEWSCVAEAVGVESGQLQIGLHDPASDSDGIVGLAAMAGGLLATNDLPFSNIGFGSGAFLEWIRRVQQVAYAGSGPVERILQFNGAMTNSAVVTEAEALSVLGRAGSADRLALRYPTPLASLTAIAVGVDGADVGDAADGVADALREQGWRGPDGAPADDSAPPLPDDDGLPSGGVLVALQEQWS